MDFAQFLPWAVFGGLMCAIWFALSQYSGKSASGDDRLQTLVSQEEWHHQETEQISQMPELLERVIPKLSQILEPKDRLENYKLKLRMANAGFNGPHAVNIYLAIRVVLFIGGAVLGSSVGLACFGIAENSLFAGIIGAAIGFYLPVICVYFIAKARQERIFLAMPSALDLLVICIEVGKGLDAAMREVAYELGAAAPDLCEEFNIFNSQVQLGRPRHEALHNLGVRAGVDDLNSLATVLIQADRFGASIANTLRQLSDSMRIKRRQLAEERAQKTAVKLLFPLVLFIFPGIFVVLVGPAAISMINDMLSVQ